MNSKSPEPIGTIDFVLFAFVCALVIFGMIMVYSSSFILAQERYGDGFAFIKKQLAFGTVGFGALILALKVPVSFWKKNAPRFFGGAVLLLLAVLIPGVGSKIGGASRWIVLPFFSIQPAEVAKLAAVFYTAWMLERKKTELHRFVPGVVSPYIGVGLLMMLLLAQPDFGSTAIIGIVVFLMLLIAGVRAHFLTLMVVVGGALGSLLILAAPYRRARLMTFLDPWQDPLGKGFQVLQSMLALHNGGISGMGLGNGKEKLFYLPEAHNDFLFAVIGEELGFLGAISVLSLFGLILYRGMKISHRYFEEKNDLFGSLLAAGITLALVLQAFVNMGVVVGALPTKGLTLPFLSYGGSALIVNLFSIGILLRISKELSAEPVREFEAKRTQVAVS